MIILGAQCGLHSSLNENFAKDFGVNHVVLPKQGYNPKIRSEHKSEVWCLLKVENGMRVLNVTSAFSRGRMDWTVA